MADTVIVKGREEAGGKLLRRQQYLSVYSRRLSPRARMAERGKPVRLLWQQRKARRKTSYSLAGKGGSSKQTLIGNKSDTSVNHSARK